MDISVIIPTYKPQDYIWDCLDSLKCQTFDKERFEIIIILNGCKEPYQSKILSYISLNLKIHNVHFIQTDEPGVSNARNIGLDEAHGDYIAFIDDDDYVSSIYLENLYKHIGINSIPISNVLAFNDGENGFIDYYITNMFAKIKTEHALKIMHARSYMSIPVAKLINRDYIGIRRFDKRLKNGEDSLFMLGISDKIKYVRPTSEKAIYYRRNRTNSAVTRHKKFSEILNNKVNLFFAYIPYLLRPWRYNILFCISRFAALLKPTK